MQPGPNIKSSGRIQRRCGFTLTEMLVVIAIIIVLATIGLPALKGFGESNRMTAASRQMLEDLQFARQKAISGRTTVYMLFVPPSLPANIPFINSLPTFAERKMATNLSVSQFTTYALFTKKSVGEQPGRDNPKDLTPWRSLPDGIFVSLEKFNSGSTNHFSYNLLVGEVPFPTADSPNYPAQGSPPNLLGIPCIAFDSRGRLVSGVDQVVPLTKGGIFYDRDPNGQIVIGLPDVKETPLNNSVDNFNRIRIDWLTGRGRIERPEVQ